MTNVEYIAQAKAILARPADTIAELLETNRLGLSIAVNLYPLAECAAENSDLVEPGYRDALELLRDHLANKLKAFNLPANASVCRTLLDLGLFRV